MFLLFRDYLDFPHILVFFLLVSTVQFREDLKRIAMTTLSSKILSQDKEHFADLAVDAVLRLKVEIGSI